MAVSDLQRRPAPHRMRDKGMLIGSGKIVRIVSADFFNSSPTGPQHPLAEAATCRQDQPRMSHAGRATIAQAEAAKLRATGTFQQNRQ